MLSVSRSVNGLNSCWRWLCEGQFKKATVHRYKTQTQIESASVLKGFKAKYFMPDIKGIYKLDRALIYINNNLLIGLEDKTSETQLEL